MPVVSPLRLDPAFGLVAAAFDLVTAFEGSFAGFGGGGTTTGGLFPGGGPAGGGNGALALKADAGGGPCSDKYSNSNSREQ